MSKGYFITLEGGEGSGKTTASHKIKEELERLGYEVVLTREPGGVSISEQIRNIILSDENSHIDHRTEALLFASARRQHLVEKVIPSLKQGKIVLCDRFIDSSVVYQGHVNGIGAEEILKINDFAIDGWMPDLTLFFEISPEEGLRRIAYNTNREVNRLDLKNLSFHTEVYKGYFEQWFENKDRIKLIDASKDVEGVVEQCMNIINKHLLQK